MILEVIEAAWHLDPLNDRFKAFFGNVTLVVLSLEYKILIYCAVLKSLFYTVLQFFQRLSKLHLLTQILSNHNMRRPFVVIVLNLRLRIASIVLWRKLLIRLNIVLLHILFPLTFDIRDRRGVFYNVLLRFQGI